MERLYKYSKKDEHLTHNTSHKIKWKDDTNYFPNSFTVAKSMKSLKKYGISINGIQDLFPGLKAQGNDPIVEWRKLQNIGVRPRGTHPYKDTHPSPPPLSMANFRLEQSPAPLRGTGSRAQVVHWVELDYSQFCSTSHTSSGYSHSERWHSISQVPFWVAGDLSGRVTALGCYLAYIATDSYYASCGRWVYSRAYIFFTKNVFE